MSFTPVFGGTVLAPSNQNYAAIAMSSNVTLGWALEQQGSGGIPIASHMEITPSAGGLSITLPAANQGSSGFAVVFTNAGASAFTVLDANGGAVCSIGSGESWYVYLDDNTSVAGVWGVFQFGAGVSNANAAALAGAGLKAITTSLNQKLDIQAKSSNYVVVGSDRATLLNWTSGNGTFTLPDPAVVGSDWFVMVRNSGNGLLTVTPAAGMINGAASLVLSPGDSCIAATDGVDFYTVGAPIIPPIRSSTTNPAPTTGYSGGVTTLQLDSNNNICTILFRISGATGDAAPGAGWVSGTIPVGFRPPTDRVITGMVTVDTTRYPGILQISADGSMTMSRFDFGNLNTNLNAVFCSAYSLNP